MSSGKQCTAKGISGLIDSAVKLGVLFNCIGIKIMGGSCFHGGAPNLTNGGPCICLQGPQIYMTLLPISKLADRMGAYNHGVLININTL